MTATTSIITSASYESRTIKRARRTRDAIDAIKAAIVSTLEEIQPATVRQLYYQLVSRRKIEKTEAEYKTLVRLLALMRRAGEVPFDYVTDNTRWMRKPESHCGLNHLLRDTAALYRRDLWQNQPVYVEIWLEKVALSGVLYDVTSEYDVPLMVTGGYSSVTFLHSAAEEIANIKKPTYLYHFGDYDPSGVNITKKVESGIREFAPDAEVYFERVAVTDAQIAEYDLPTRPTKKSDTRAKNFDGESVEVDAIAPDDLRRLVRYCITRHIDVDALTVMQAAERSERQWLTDLAAKGVRR